MSTAALLGENHVEVDEEQVKIEADDQRPEKTYHVEVEVEHMKVEAGGQKPEKLNTSSFAVWLDSWNNRTDHVELTNEKENSKKTLKLEDLSLLCARKLELHVTFYKNHHVMGKLRVPLGTCVEFSDIDSIEVKPPFSDYDATLAIHVKQPEEFFQFLCRNLNNAWQDSNKVEFDWLDEIEDWANKSWGNWRGVKAFLLYFTPARQIAEDSFRAQRQLPWLAGHSDNLVAGPGIIYAAHVNFVALGYYCFVLYMFGFALIPGCFQTLPEQTIVPTPWTFYAVYFLPAFLKLYCEFAILGCVLPAKVLGAGVPKVWFTATKWPAKLWVTMKVIGSLAASLDVFSSSIFLSRVLAQHRLESISNHTWTMEDPWLRSLEKTNISVWNVFWMLGGYPRFEQMVWMLWLTVFLEVLWACAYSIPVTNELQSSQRKEQEVWYDFRRVRLGDGTRLSRTARGSAKYVPYRRKHLGSFDMYRYMRKRLGSSNGEEPKDGEPEDEEPKDAEPEEVRGFTDFAEYHTALVRYQVHGRALVALQKSARLSMGLAMDSEYVVRMVEHWKPKDVYDYQRQSSHFFIVFMIQRLLTTSVQASFIGISKNLTQNRHMDVMTFMSVLLGCALGLSTIVSEVLLHYDLTEQLRVRAQNAAKSPWLEKRQKSDMNYHRGWSRFTFLITFTFAFLSVITFLYCLCKAYAGLFACPCGMMNVGFFRIDCVDFADSETCTMGTNWTTRPETVKRHFAPHLALLFWNASVPDKVCSAFLLN